VPESTRPLLHTVLPRIYDLGDQIAHRPICVRAFDIYVCHCMRKICMRFVRLYMSEDVSGSVSCIHHAPAPWTSCMTTRQVATDEVGAKVSAEVSDNVRVQLLS
jgi:hypothetical protein